MRLSKHTHTTQNLWSFFFPYGLLPSLLTLGWSQFVPIKGSIMVWKPQCLKSFTWVWGLGKMIRSRWMNWEGGREDLMMAKRVFLSVLTCKGWPNTQGSWRIVFQEEILIAFQVISPFSMRIQLSLFQICSLHSLPAMSCNVIRSSTRYTSLKYFLNTYYVPASPLFCSE